MMISAESPRYRSLESLRGVAAVLVALFHSGFVVDQKWPVIAQGDIFVDLFFVLSGFVMFHAYADRIAGGLRFSRYVLLRIGRLYPLHLFMLLIWMGYVLIRGFVHGQYGLGADPFVNSNLYTLVSNLLLLQSMGLHDLMSWNYPSWSVSVEFYTYLVFFLLISRLGQAWNHHYLLLMSVAMYGVLWIANDQSLLRTVDYGFPRCLGGFFLGAWVRARIGQKRWQAKRIIATLLELGVLAILLALIVNSMADKVVQLTTFVWFAVVVGVFSIQNAGLVSRLLEHNAMVMLGTLSYSIYLIHAIVFAVVGQVHQYILQGEVVWLVREGAEPLKLLLTPFADLINLGCLAFILVLAFFSYTHIEAPARNRFRALGTRLSDR